MSKTNCDCNENSLVTANTGFATVATANSGLDGKGTLATVLTGAANGTMVKSVIVKAIAPTLQGMVRLFISDTSSGAITLYREIPIPTYPEAPAVPVPAPVWPTLEIDLLCNLKLQSGLILVASTQNQAKFNIIAEGLDWAYPSTLPSGCCYIRNETAITGTTVIDTANTNTDGTGGISRVFVADSGSNGTTIKSITVAALQSTHQGMIRFFISSDSGATYTLMMEVFVPESTQSAFQPSFKQVLNDEFNLQAGYTIGVSTQNAEPFAITVEGESWSYAIS